MTAKKCTQILIKQKKQIIFLYIMREQSPNYKIQKVLLKKFIWKR